MILIGYVVASSASSDPSSSLPYNSPLKGKSCSNFLNNHPSGCFHPSEGQRGRVYAAWEPKTASVPHCFSIRISRWGATVGSIWLPFNCPLGLPLLSSDPSPIPATDVDPPGGLFETFPPYCSFEGASPPSRSFRLSILDHFCPYQAEGDFVSCV